MDVSAQDVIIEVFKIPEGNISPKTQFAWKFKIGKEDRERQCKVTIKAKYFDKDGNQIGDEKSVTADVSVAKNGEGAGNVSAPKPETAIDAPENAKGVSATITVECEQLTGTATATSGTAKPPEQRKPDPAELDVKLTQSNFKINLQGDPPLMNNGIIIDVSEGGTGLNRRTHATIVMTFTFKDAQQNVVATESYTLVASGRGSIKSQAQRGGALGLPNAYRTQLLDAETKKRISSAEAKVTIVVKDEEGKAGFVEQTEPVKVIGGK